MKSIQLQITNKVGLHARPAAVFVQRAGKHQSKITLRNATTGSVWANAKSILSVLTLGVEQGHEIELRAEGPDETEAIHDLTELVSLGLGEEKPSQ